MAAANILNKESQTADKEWSSILWIGWGLTTPYHNRLACYKMLTQGLGLDFNKQNLVSHFKGRTQIYVSITGCRGEYLEQRWKT
jgi:hypothetical protein